MFISTWNYFITWTVSATFVESRPGSTADAISLYVPGAVNVAVVIAWPFDTGIAPVFAKVTFAGPLY